MRGLQCASLVGRDLAQSRLGDFQGGSDHVRRVVVNRCGRSGCRACWEAWAARQGGRAEERLLAAQALYKQARRPGGGAIKHWAASPPRELVAELVDQGIQGADLERELRRRARLVMREAGYLGGLDIFHPWRSRAHGAGKYRRGRNYFSPHFHFVGVGHLVGGEVVHARTGWVVKNLGVRGSIARTVSYLLDHVGVQEGAHAVKWSGSLSYNKVVTAREEKKEEAVQCPCGRAAVESPIRPGTDDVDWSLSYGPFMARVVVRTYRLAGMSQRELSCRKRERLDDFT